MAAPISCFLRIGAIPSLGMRAPPGRQASSLLDGRPTKTCEPCPNCIVSSQNREDGRHSPPAQQGENWNDFCEKDICGRTRARRLPRCTGLCRRRRELQDRALRRCGLDRHSGHDRRHAAWCSKRWATTPEVKTLSVPVTYASLKNKDIDVFLGNWMPSMTADIQPYLDDKSVEQIGDQSRRRGLWPRRSAICGGCRGEVAGRSWRQRREVRRQDLRHRGRQ